MDGWIPWYFSMSYIRLLALNSSPSPFIFPHFISSYRFASNHVFSLAHLKSAWKSFHVWNTERNVNTNLLGGGGGLYHNPLGVLIHLHLLRDMLRQFIDLSQALKHARVFICLSSIQEDSLYYGACFFISLCSDMVLCDRMFLWHLWPDFPVPRLCKSWLFF